MLLNDNLSEHFPTKQFYKCHQTHEIINITRNNRRGSGGGGVWGKNAQVKQDETMPPIDVH